MNCVVRIHSLDFTMIVIRKSQFPCRKFAKRKSEESRDDVGAANTHDY